MAQSIGDRDLSVFWHKRYTRRRQRVYTPGDLRLDYELSRGPQSLITAFLDSRRSQQLDPPLTFRYPALRRFLNTGDIKIFTSGFNSDAHHATADTILLDDRRDPSGDANSTRVWDSEGDPGYLKYSPPGEIIFSGRISIKELVIALTKPVSTHLTTH